MTRSTHYVYLPAANPADRFLGAPCGCVFILRRYADLAPHSIAQAESFYFCAPCMTDRGQHIEPGVRRCDWQVASVYHYAPEANLCYYAPVQSGEGIRWQ